MTPSSPAWNSETVLRIKSLSNVVIAAQSELSRLRSIACGSQVPSRLAFWNRRIGTESQSSPRPEMVA